jgi:hypothetical protein
MPNDLPCTVKGEHTLTVTFKLAPESDSKGCLTTPTKYIGTYSPFCSYCNIPLETCRLVENV